MKIVTALRGYFELTEEALERLRKLKGAETFYNFDAVRLPRNDKDLIKVVEEMGDLAYPIEDDVELAIIDIPNDKACFEISADEIGEIVEPVDDFEQVTSRFKNVKREIVINTASAGLLDWLSDEAAQMYLKKKFKVKKLYIYNESEDEPSTLIRSTEKFPGSYYSPKDLGEKVDIDTYLSSGFDWIYRDLNYIKRHDPILVDVIKKLGDKASMSPDIFLPKVEKVEGFYRILTTDYECGEIVEELRFCKFY